MRKIFIIFLIITSVFLTMLSGYFLINYLWKPTIILDGQEQMYLEVGEEFIDPGAKISDGTIKVFGEVNTNKLGSYTVVYSDINDVVSIERIVHVVDRTPPVITLSGEVDSELYYNSDFVEYGYTVKDNYDNNPIVQINGTIDTSKIGEQVITYTAIDSSNNTTTVTRTVDVYVVHEINGDNHRFLIDSKNDEYVYIQIGMESIERIVDDTVELKTLSAIPSNHGYNIATVTEDDQNNLTIIGNVYNLNGNKNPYITRIDKYGNLIWSKVYEEIPVFYSYVTDTGTSFIIVCKERTDNEESVSIYGIDYSGKIIFQNTLDDEGGNKFLKGIVSTSNGFTVYTGYYYSNYPPVSGDIFYNFSLDGELISKHILSEYLIHDAITIDDKIIVAAHNLDSSNSSSNYIYIYNQINNELVPLVDLDNTMTDLIVKLPDKTFIVVGGDYTHSDLSRRNNVFIKHINIDGTILKDVEFDSLKGLVIEKYYYFVDDGLAFSVTDRNNSFILYGLNERFYLTK